MELQKEKLEEALIVQLATPNHPGAGPYQQEDDQHQSPIGDIVFVFEKPESKGSNFIFIVGAAVIAGLTVAAIRAAMKRYKSRGKKRRKVKPISN